MNTVLSSIGLIRQLYIFFSREIVEGGLSSGIVCFFGPCTPYQYRLEGPGKTTTARDLIMTQWDRVAASMKTRPVSENKSSQPTKWILMLILFGFFIKCFLAIYS